MPPSPSPLVPPRLLLPGSIKKSLTRDEEPKCTKESQPSPQRDTGKASDLPPQPPPPPHASRTLCSADAKHTITTTTKKGDARAPALRSSKYYMRAIWDQCSLRVPLHLQMYFKQMYFALFDATGRSRDTRTPPPPPSCDWLQPSSDPSVR
ncbi:unnamed protein product [Pleuronectes platessa]|uniref:Uncharacterized protein n=1 Tax=Pleuronectes platessa TaxID=8262 RepID=A0A9N7Y7G2_PLEPL|nr:unnamed protein product [Pleuronectes platessa]